MNTRTAVSRAALSPSRKALALLAILTLSGSALAGCASRDNDGAGSSSPSASPSASATVSPEQSSASASPSEPGTDATAPAKAAPVPCTAGTLTGAVEDIPGGATGGGVYRALVLTNASADTSCTLAGYPGVSYLDAAGTQVGAPAARAEGGQVVPVTLEPGQAAAAELQETVAQKYGECQVQPTSSLLVYPPDDTASLSIDYPSTGCLNEDIELMHIGVLQAR